MSLSCYWQWISSSHCQSSLRIHSFFDNVMTKFMINNRTDAWKTDVNLLNWPWNRNTAIGNMVFRPNCKVAQLLQSWRGQLFRQIQIFYICFWFPTELPVKTNFKWMIKKPFTKDSIGGTRFWANCIVSLYFWTILRRGLNKHIINNWLKRLEISQENNGGLFDNNQLWINCDFSIEHQAWEVFGLVRCGNCGEF